MSLKKVHVKYFASLREAIGTPAEDLDTAMTDLQSFRKELCQRGDRYNDVLSADKLVRMALNQRMAEPTAALSEGDEVAFFPPVTGG